MRSEWPVPTSRPRRRDGAPAVPLDDNLALYDNGGQLLILLNVSAAAVWTRCNGDTTFDEIVGDLAQSHEGDLSQIADDAWHTVRKLSELGLLEEATQEEAERAGSA